ncbi:ABC transporter permease [Opitutaceae bacterium EW11]|nr:ABC transporter permease [Opitutaceae bacterium EW11]
MPAEPDVIAPQAQALKAGDGVVVQIGGRWRVTEPHPSWRELLGSEKPKSVKVVLKDLERWDSALLLFLFDAARWCRAASVPLDTSELPESLRSLLQQLATAEVKETAVDRRTGFVQAVGIATVAVWRAVGEISRFVGEITISALHLLKFPRRFRWRDCLFEMQQCGAMALPIVGLISFLVGVTLAYTGAIILRQYGGDIYVADLVGLSMVREMGAMMTAVVLAGRTGAAFAAQIGNMRANEEVDALETLGFSPVDFLVMPRIVALALMMPLLAMYSNCLGIVGGMVIGQTVLQIPPSAYWVEMLTIVDLSDVSTGLIKAASFGLIVGLCGCLRGLQADRSAAGVGRAATSAVVTAILLIIVADSIYAVVFNILGL